MATEPRHVWTYWLSRDSIHGELSGKVHLWRERPTRVRHRYRVTWVDSDHRKSGHLGEFPPSEIAAWFRVYPETDLELIRIDTHPTPHDLERARKEQAIR